MPEVQPLRGSDPSARVDALAAPFLPLSRPSISEDEIAAVAEVLRSGCITTGVRNAEFEERFAEFTGAGRAVSLTSGTAGMHLVFQALGIGPGDEVVTPSLTCVSTVNLITLMGARPVFCDVDRDTLMASAETIQPCLSRRTRAIVPVHFAGAALDLDPIRELGRAHRVPVIEDAAHALGTEYRGERIGATGTAIFSFHPVRNITTGEGGMVTSEDTALVERVRQLRLHGLGVDAYACESGRAPRAKVIEPGFKYNLPDFAAVLGLGQLARARRFNARRAVLAAYYLKRLDDVDGISPLALPDYPSSHAWHLFVVRLDVERAGITRDDFIAHLKLHGIGAGVHFSAVHSHRYYRDRLHLPPGALAHTEWNSERICSLPLFPAMTFDDVDRVVGVIDQVLHA